MKHLKNIIFVFAGLGCFLSACDKIDTPIEEEYLESLKNVVIDPDVGFSIDELNTFSWDTVHSPDNSNKQFILLQEFTGHECYNCPPGTVELLRLDDLYGEQLIPISIHEGPFARPHVYPDGSFSSDHRVKEIVDGNYLANLGISKWPKGIINNDGEIENFGDWENSIIQIKDNEPAAAVSIVNLYNDSLKIIRSIIAYEWLENLNEDHHLQVFLSEDHVVDWQLDGSTKVPNYDHRHMLQKVVNPLYGVSVEEAIKGNTGSKEYVYKVDAEWKAKDLEVIAFLHKPQAPYNVVQVNAAAVIE